MKYDAILTSTAAILTERGKDYGDPNVCFGRIAKLASAFFERPVTEFEIAMIMNFVKLGRVMESPQHVDNWQDLINYTAFAGHFSTEVKRADPTELGLRGVNLPDNALPFAGKKAPPPSKTISEDALKQAMANVSAELDIKE